MGRLILLLLALGVIVAVTLLVAAVLRDTFGPQRRDAQRFDEELMTPTGIQKFAYVALIVLMFGTASGLLGGM